MPMIKCRYFDAETEKPINGGCRNRDCHFLHPTDKGWKEARGSSGKKFAQHRLERERTSSWDWDRDSTRQREQRDSDHSHSRTRDRTQEGSSRYPSHKDSDYTKGSRSSKVPFDNGSFSRQQSQPAASSSGRGFGLNDRAGGHAQSSKSNDANDSSWDAAGAEPDSIGWGNIGRGWSTESPSAWEPAEQAKDKGPQEYKEFRSDRAKTKKSVETWPFMSPPPGTPTSPRVSRKNPSSHTSKSLQNPSVQSSSNSPFTSSTRTTPNPSNPPPFRAQAPNPSTSAPKPISHLPSSSNTHITRTSMYDDSNVQPMSPMSVLDLKNSHHLQNASPSTTERSGMSVFSARRTSKSKLSRKILGMFDHAVKKEVEYRTVAKKYERWKKIQESPQYGRVRLNGQKKLDSVRSQLKQQRDKLPQKINTEIKAIADMITVNLPSSSSSSSTTDDVNIGEFTVKVRATLEELNEYILQLRNTQEEQKKAAEVEKEAVAVKEAKEREAAAAAVAQGHNKPREVTLDELKTLVSELEHRSYEIMDAQDENRRTFVSPEFIEEALEGGEEEEELLHRELDELDERMKDIGEEVEKLGIEIAKLSFSAQEEALQKKLDHNARLKKELELKLAALDRAAIKRREKIDDLSNQIRNLHTLPKPVYSYNSLIQPFVERIVDRIVEQELKPIILGLKATTKDQVKARQLLIAESIEKALQPIVQMTAEIVRRSNTLAATRGTVNDSVVS
ncbi:hypothetical protein FB446DRAFT_736699 [Lentinula raphanica]|nr:hypothetical protein FB446DRAFT_736699 [Lentinula raphanica]